jgi:peroxiredoxin
MAIQLGDKVPSVKLVTVDGGKVRSVTTDEVFQGKKVVLFAVPGAFTSTCSEQHLPDFIQLADTMRSRGADAVVCTAVNDIYVLQAWFQHHGVGDKIDLLADGNGDLARALGLEMDSSDYGMGVRSQRYAAVIDDGVVKALGVDPPGEVRASSAAAILQSV